MIKAATSIVITTADPVALISYQITGQLVLETKTPHNVRYFLEAQYRI